MPIKKSTSLKSHPRIPVQPRGIQTREKIIRAGEKLFIQNGFHHILADDIAREAGVSVGSFYGYFADKRDLFLQILERSSAAMMEKATEHLPSLWLAEPVNPEEAIQKTLYLLLEAHRDLSPLFQQAQQMAVFDENVRNYLLASDRSTQEIFAKMISRMNPQLGKDRLKSAAYVMYYAAEGVIHSLVNNQEADDQKEKILQETAKLLSGYVPTLMGQ
jgi:AcrR family transcriptional regulator